MKGPGDTQGYNEWGYVKVWRREEGILWGYVGKLTADPRLKEFKIVEIGKRCLERLFHKESRSLE